jgi:transcriptional regulator with XRE-family HTH domain
MSKQKDWMQVEFKALRIESKLSQKALAGLTGTAPNTIHNFEEGKSSPSIKTVEKWLNELGYEIDIHPK